MKKREKYDLTQRERDLKFLTEQVKFLCSDAETQEAKSVLFGDAIPDDIANDWDFFTCFAKSLFERKVITQKIAQLFIMIDENFAKVSKGEKQFSYEIWTLNGLKTHPFWEQQRNLAKELLNELEKVQIE